MMHRFALACSFALIASIAAAQSPAPHAFWIDANFLSSDPNQQSQTFTTAGLSTSGVPVGISAIIPPLSRANGFGVEGGVLSNLGLGIGARFERARWDYDAALGLASSHPIFISLIAVDSGTAPNLHRSDTTFDVMAVYAREFQHAQVRFSFGPSFFHVSQDMVSNIQFTRTFNIIGTINQVDIQSFSQEEVSKGGVGFTAGFDAAYFFIPNVGVGGGVRINTGKADITDPLSEQAAEIDATRLTLSAGLRLRF